MRKRTILIGLLLFVLLGGIGCSSKPGPITPAAPTPAPLSTAAPTVPTTPSKSETLIPQITKEGDKIVFQFQESIYLMNPDGTGKTELGKGSRPVWSPDGKKLVYQRSVYEEFYGVKVISTESILVVDFDRRSTTEIARTSGRYVDPPMRFISWAPDSKKFAYLVAGEGWTGIGNKGTVNIVDAGTGLTSKLDDINGLLDYPFAWSSDGRKVAYVNNYDNLVVMNIDGSAKVRLVAELDGPPQIRWSPAGDKIIYTRYQHRGWREARDHWVNVDGTGETDPGAINSVWSPDGKGVAYQRIKDGPDSLEVWYLGKVVTISAQTEGFPPSFLWSPDGRKLVYRKYDPYGPDYQIFNVETGVSVPIGDNFGTAAWSPNEEKILYEMDGVIHVIGADGTDDIKLEGHTAQWSPDGKRIAYQFIEKFGKEVLGEYIYVVNADGTGKTRLAEGSNPVWSPGPKPAAIAPVGGGVTTAPAPTQSSGQIPAKPATLLASDAEYHSLYATFNSWGMDFNTLFPTYSTKGLNESWTDMWIGSAQDENRRVYFDRVGDKWKPRTIPR